MAGCLNSMNFSMMSIGRPRGNFKSSKGNPYRCSFCVLCTDMLSILLKRATEKEVC